jgi:hypothetical protein
MRHSCDLIVIGTVGRQLGKRLKYVAKSVRKINTDDTPRANGPREHRGVSFENSGRPTSTV